MLGYIRTICARRYFLNALLQGLVHMPAFCFNVDFFISNFDTNFYRLVTQAIAQKI
ncbi:MAG: hypothetical protein ACR2LR_29080 [Hassallia sp.]